MDVQIPYRLVDSNLNKSGPWIYQNGKIMFHMTLPYGEVRDSDHYSICAEITAQNDLWEVQAGNRKDTPKNVRKQRNRDSGGEGVYRPQTHEHQDSAGTQIMGYLKGKSSRMLFEGFQNLKYKFGKRTLSARAG